jgi:hypothetical protein
VIAVYDATYGLSLLLLLLILCWLALYSPAQYWLCRAAKEAAQADEAFASKGIDIHCSQWYYCEVQFFVFERETRECRA